MTDPTNTFPTGTGDATTAVSEPAITETLPENKDWFDTTKPHASVSAEPAIVAEAAVVEPALVVDDFDLDAVIQETTTDPLLVTPVIQENDEPSAPLAFAANATHQYSATLPSTVGSPDTIQIPPATQKDIEARLGQVPNVDLTLSSKQQKWAETLRSSLIYMPMEGVYSDRMAKPSAKFVQSVNWNGAELRGRAPTFNSTPGTKEVEGERALLQLVSHLGVGSLFRAPLWASGLWITFKPATETEQLELNRILFADKIALGRWSYGLALSNYVVYTLDRVFEFALQHVYNTNIKAEELPISKLRDYIAPQDVNSFIWGFLCANYPSGFHYETGCINDPDKCNFVIEETLNVTKLQNTDEAELTEWQKQHMTGMSANSKSLDSLKRYREESKALQSRRIVINEGTPHELAVTIKTPTITQYIEQGHRWIGGIVENINRTLGMDPTAEERNVAINQMGKATTLCQYSHWIESIEYGEVSVRGDGIDARAVSMIKDMATIEDTLKTLSSTDIIRERIIKEVLAYISDSTVSIIGVPAFDCPVCHKPQEGDDVYPKKRSVIPLDVLQVFFGLLSQRLDRIETR